MNSTTNVSNVRHQLPVYVSWIVTSLCQIQGGYQEQEQEQKQRKQKKEFLGSLLLYKQKEEETTVAILDVLVEGEQQGC